MTQTFLSWPCGDKLPCEDRATRRGTVGRLEQLQASFLQPRIPPPGTSRRTAPQTGSADTFAIGWAWADGQASRAWPPRTAAREQAFPATTCMAFCPTARENSHTHIHVSVCYDSDMHSCSLASVYLPAQQEGASRRAELPPVWRCPESLRQTAALSFAPTHSAHAPNQPPQARAGPSHPEH